MGGGDNIPKQNEGSLEFTWRQSMLKAQLEKEHDAVKAQNEVLGTRNKTLYSRVSNLEQQVFFLTAFATASLFWAVVANQDLGVF